MAAPAGMPPLDVTLDLQSESGLDVGPVVFAPDLSRGVIAKTSTIVVIVIGIVLVAKAWFSSGRRKKRKSK